MTLFLTRIAVVLAACMLALPAGAADLKVFSTTAFTELWHELKPKFEARGHKLELVLQPSGALAKRIGAGETGDAIVSTSAGVDIVGPFPAELNNITGFTAAVLSTSANPGAAQALVDFLASPATIALLKARGYDTAR